MAGRSKADIISLLLKGYGRTYFEDIGIDLKNTPSPLFQGLVAAILYSARIRSGTAALAARALFEEGWTTPEKMAGARWGKRTRILNRSGYARYDGRTSTMLEEASRYLLDRYGGDLRKLREEAREDPGKERRLLKKFKGIGDVGADIFFRETQLVWDELYPFADKKPLKAAGRLGLPQHAERLSREVSREDFPRLVSALVRAAGADALEDIRKGRLHGGAEELNALSKKELYERAKKLGVPGRSRMGKKELVKEIVSRTRS
ncbi:MAG: hypothetical protein ACOC78_01870 [Actinomycetota bacterium]